MKPYEKYKPSGIEWIGDIPKHWEVKKISHGFQKIGSGTTPTSGNEEYYNGEYNWLQTGDLTDNDINSTSKKITQKALDDFSTLRFYTPNSLVIAMYGATIGKTGILNIETTTNQACCVLSEPNSFQTKYAFYWFNANKNHIISLSYGGGQPNISQEIIKSIRIPCPPKEEQTAIARYLDQKTAALDSLVVGKQKLIALLKEERTAFINQAVNGEGKNWEIVKFNHYIRLRHGYQFMNYDFTSSGIKVVKITQLSPNGYLDLSQATFIDSSRLDEFNDILINEGDVLMALTGGTIGKIIRVGKVEEPLLQNYRVGNFFPANDKITKDFIFWVLSSEMILSQIYFEQRETGQPNIGKENFNTFKIALPPLKEQSEIVQRIQAETQRIDSTISKIEKEISLLQEYRTALISEVVTGKIKVM